MAAVAANDRAARERLARAHEAYARLLSKRNAHDCARAHAMCATLLRHPERSPQTVEELRTRQTGYGGKP